MSDPVDVGTRRELFVDDFLIDHMEGVRLKLAQPERRETVITFDAPWESNVTAPASVIAVDGKLRMTYRALIFFDGNKEDTQLIGMLESDDGFSFYRPQLGLVEYHGSSANNLIYHGGPPLPPPPFLDTRPGVLPEQRFKGLSPTWRKLRPMSSPDGINWSLMTEKPLEMSGTFDTINTAFWDSHTNCYRSFTRYMANFDKVTHMDDLTGPKTSAIRSIQSSVSDDFIHWSDPVPHQYQDGNDDMQLYTNATVPCPGAEHIYLSFAMRYEQERKADSNHPYYGVSDAVFMASRDAVHWYRYSEAWVRPGLDPMNWSERSNIPTWGIIESSPTEWSMYIQDHYRREEGRPRVMRLSIRPWGFASISGDFTGGSCTTHPIRFSGGRLSINFSTSAAGSVEVELLDPEGRAIAGFAKIDMTPMYGDELDRVVTWNKGSDVSSLMGEPIRLRFILKDADVYSFRTIE